MNSARSHSKRWSRCRSLPPVIPYSGLYSRFGVVTMTVRGAANPNTARSSALSRSGSTCSMTSMSTAASSPASRASR